MRHHPRSWILFATLAAWSASACDSDPRVSHGQLDRCFGDRTHCSASVDTLTIKTQPPKSCDAEPQPLERAFLTALDEEICGQDLDSCSLWVDRIAPRQDGGAWVLGRRPSDTTEELWLAHLDAAGAVRAIVSVDQGMPFNGGSVIHRADMAVDARDHAFIVVYRIDPGPNADSGWAEESWVQEVDAEGKLVRGPIDELGVGPAQIVVSTDGRMTIAGNALENGRYGVLGQLDAAGDAVWSTPELQTDGTSRGVVGLSAGADGEFWVAMQREDQTPSSMALTRFDAHGTVVQDGVLDIEIMNGELLSFAGGPRGHVNVMVRAQVEAPTPEEQSTGFVPVFRAFHFDATGHSTWTYRLAIVSNPWLATNPQDGSVYAGDDGELVRIAEDGRTCERFTLRDEDASLYETDLGAVADDGRIWFSSRGRIGMFQSPHAP